VSDTGSHAPRSVIVTGSASGIGRAAAKRFAAGGDRVVIADIDAERAKEVTAEITAAGGTAIAAIGDLSDRQVVENVVAAAVETFGGLDVLVNNAGILDQMSAVGETGDVQWERVLQVNLTAPFLVTRAALPHLLRSESAAIVFTASQAALRGSAAGAAYTVSKHGVVGLAKSLAVMYRDQGIRTNCVAPGATITNLQIVTDPESEFDLTSHGPTVIGRYQADWGRWADADEPAAAIVFLASPSASNINGVVLPVDNGWSAV
jgi:NAD(P)-dependent dehydrogenase (short-subunit alcohol dehydrogenase family)